MTYYTLPKLFRNNNTNIINTINIKFKHNNEIQDDSLLEKLLNTLITESNKHKYEEIKSLHSFTDLLNLKISDEIYHPKSYFAFIEISKITNIFSKPNLVSFHMSDSYDYLDALYQLRKYKDEYVYITEETTLQDIPEYIKSNIVNANTILNISTKYLNYADLICINYDEINYIVKYLLLSLLTQRKGGICILKIKRLNNHISKEIIYLLMSLYENVMIIKPKIVNSINEYKYIVAVNMCNNINASLDKINMVIQEIFKLKHDEQIVKLLDTDVPQMLINKIDECELIMSENTLLTHMKICNSININNVNIKSLEKKNEHDTKIWLKENNIV